jgi:hypothetical protein
MQSNWDQRVRDFILAYEVHVSLPVPIRQAVRDAGWTVRFRERIAPSTAS